MRQIVVGLLQIASGLASMHHHAIVHHDLRQANILLTPDGSAFNLVDFGNATFKYKGGTKTRKPNMQPVSL